MSLARSEGCSAPCTMKPYPSERKLRARTYAELQELLGRVQQLLRERETPQSDEIDRYIDQIAAERARRQTPEQVIKPYSSMAPSERLGAQLDSLR